MPFVQDLLDDLASVPVITDKKPIVLDEIDINSSDKLTMTEA
jgi:hypothetical protein